jgi:hypothetical protein
MYDGKVVAIHVVNMKLSAQCQAPAAPDDPRLMKAGEPPVNSINVGPFTNEAMAGALGRTLYDYERWLRQGYDVEMTIVGRIDVRPGDVPLGLGHLGAYPAQITITRIEKLKRSAKKGPERKIITVIE